MKKVIVSAFALILFATVSYAQDVKKSGPATTQTQQAAPANTNTQAQPAQPQSDNNTQTANNESTEAKQSDAADKKTETAPQTK